MTRPSMATTRGRILFFLKTEEGRRFITAARIAELSNMSTRTVFRHLKALRADGHQIDSNQGKDGGLRYVGNPYDG